MQPTKIPNEEDWIWPDGEEIVDWGELLYAEKRFSGKSLEEATQIVSDTAICASEELYYTSPIPFQYYVFAFCKYLEDPSRFNEFEASTVASTFLGLVRIKLQNYPTFIIPVMDDLMPTIEYVGANQALLDASEEIYGSFADDVAEIKRIYESVKNLIP